MMMEYQGTTYVCSKCGYSFTIKPGQITTSDVKTHCGLIMQAQDGQASAEAKPKERYTPGLWKSKHIGGHAWQVFSLLNEKPIAVVTTTEHDARLIAEAPNLFQLVKQGLDIDGNEERQCPCMLCEAACDIVQRVLEG